MKLQVNNELISNYSCVTLELINFRFDEMNAYSWLLIISKFGYCCYCCYCKYLEISLLIILMTSIISYVHTNIFACQKAKLMMCSNELETKLIKMKTTKKSNRIEQTKQKLDFIYELTKYSFEWFTSKAINHHEFINRSNSPS